MREVAGSTPGLDFYILCEPIYVSLRLFGLIEEYNKCMKWEKTAGWGV
jgi:hypothetical protein